MEKIDSQHPLVQLLGDRHVVLGSQSPRRVELLTQLGIPYECRPGGATEEYDAATKAEEVPLLLARRKAEYLRPTLASNEVLITADTIVILDHKVLGKPKDKEEAQRYLDQLSGQWHRVITGFCIMTHDKLSQESVASDIRFANLHPDEIAYYVSQYEVLDKAGAYGIQDWIGLIGVTEIRGSYHNVMGLPTAVLYSRLKELLSE
ncbi:Maf family nucleotide pyrophosphatase [Porphyromonas levii]|uniref:dTTP/UTP pyrophosphatase n=1 Tax=Porphyromonas levii TaxID=28114 RepID=A0A4Y8WNL6_9PORP|nr:Maf family nucleotide pyrophosphatase [Porphyromonas levii]TFH94722.1 septum formation protein Maf [Porphyromonas levii]TFH96281.1 septum formation protein Maf [Porphyromonas levii]